MKKSRRDFIRKAGYAAPAVLTMATMPALASIGSVDYDDGQPVVAQPARWQSRSDRNALRRQEEQGAEVERFDWSQVDPTTYWD